MQTHTHTPTRDRIQLRHPRGSKRTGFATPKRCPNPVEWTLRWRDGGRFLWSLYWIGAVFRTSGRKVRRWWKLLDCGLLCLWYPGTLGPVFEWMSNCQLQQYWALLVNRQRVVGRCSASVCALEVVSRGLTSFYPNSKPVACVHNELLNDRIL